MPEPTTTITRYEVSVLPATHPDRHYWSVIVASTDHGWAVWDADGAYDQDGQRVPIDNASPHSDQAAALAIARRVAPNVTLNGHPVPAA
ncbi:hypothetical protein ACF06X_33625 [Streptomyces sp. NPDC015346]|uniref:hypothetical protein n=1 Tax=Streptomyces sp. NPDC015346 TaxID=3364954 RepID=UPI003702E193